MRKIKALIGIGLISLALAGCAPQSWSDDVSETEEPAEMTRPDTIVFEQSVPEGGTVTCIASKRYDSGGLSCDWVGYRIEYPESE